MTTELLLSLSQGEISSLPSFSSYKSLFQRSIGRSDGVLELAITYWVTELVIVFK